MNQLKFLITISLLKLIATSSSTALTTSIITNSTTLTTSINTTTNPTALTTSIITNSTTLTTSISTTENSTNLTTLARTTSISTTQSFSTIQISIQSDSTSTVVLSVLAFVTFIIVILAIVYQYNKNKRNIETYANISYRNSQVVNTTQQRIDNNEIVEFSNPAFHLDEWNLDQKTQKK
jgi:hypothetical protein